MIRYVGAAVIAALFLLSHPSPAIAQDVELRSLDGSVTLEGNLISYDGAYYRIETEFGPMTVSAQGVACAGPGCPDLTTFVAEARIAGAATVAEGLMPELLQGFAEAQGMALRQTEGADGTQIFTLSRRDGSPAARFHLTPGTTDAGFLALLNGETDIALALREPNAAERRAAEAAAPDDPALERRVRVLALDALVPVVSPENPVDAISLPDLARLFGGEVTNWSELGGPDAPVALHLLSPGLGLAQGFADRVLVASDSGLSEEVTRHDSGAALAAAVANDPYAVGIMPRSSRGLARSLPLRGACGFSQLATPDAVKAEDYPLTAPVYLYLAPRRLPQLVRQFLDFTRSETAERMVQSAGYVNQSLTRTPLAWQGARLANAIAGAGEDVTLADLQTLVARLDGAERLSPTFRFGDGTAELDTQSRASVLRLAAAIERGAFDGRRLIFVGFSDSAGAAAVNRRLSLRRAETVREAVIAAAEAVDPDRVEMIVEAFGEAMPMACDDTDWGRAVNRRVEVWLE
ncbi:phosphate ABC transporter substrate-binding/OmpA family protein [Roseibacterium beibuensis]|uniref:Phosphate ABC transporter substrate-binding/OmpA family protein n=1 Tax=[Roseibacterium] beibuensis TaxID=1193142 RepID=A0ABP9LIC5_9RHOB|nr:phosphate ABC transporter substrate-binding/OmpA family protein [Roseibacterium beibuensis]MCS6623028.1 phosphate ABC transporter substrate-binding/OmpA family protein [Roseibacterium beibuensis]